MMALPACSTARSRRRQTRMAAAAHPVAHAVIGVGATLLIVWLLLMALPVAAQDGSSADGDAGSAGAGRAATAEREPAAKARIAELQAELTQARQAQAQAEARVAELETTLAQQDERRQGIAREHTAQLSAAELRAREHKERLLDAEARIKALEGQLAERTARLDALEDMAAAREALSQRLEALRARLPAPEGGSLTAAQARHRAEADARRLADLVADARGIDNPRLWGEVRSAENALHHSQFLLARADNARTVYRVRPGDSLRQISLLFYGTAERWSDLFEANRHVLADPTQLPPGMTLVVP
ncbi:LysM peptidoglycan-binding domain-containing protein [uncultured Thiohalocapsa sp.]|uniref:LysM peptidoglycan-binding domain-containing protein n=1 Tax=uncultured Thiohalocapsa sp. TaxID=768990 RepID=UPI0025D6E74A|nr:LysM peptidoglycan-binding domain-containing protein [uncultured Thiohalocapsa sp.]